MPEDGKWLPARQQPTQTRQPRVTAHCTVQVHVHALGYLRRATHSRKESVTGAVSGVSLLQRQCPDTACLCLQLHVNLMCCKIVSCKLQFTYILTCTIFHRICLECECLEYIIVYIGTLVARCRMSHTVCKQWRPTKANRQLRQLNQPHPRSY